MNSLRRITLWLGVCCGFASLLGCQIAHAQNMIQEQLQALAPGEQDLQGFTSIRPAGELPLLQTYSSSQGESVKVVSSATRIEDQITVDADATQWLLGWAELRDHPGKFSQIRRYLYTTNDSYELAMTINVCSSPEMAQAEITEFLHGCSARFQPGTFNSAVAVGEESWVNPNGYSTLIFRIGKVVVLVDGSTTRLAGMAGNVPSFPPAAVEAVAYQVLLRASHQPALTGITPQQASVNINGHALSKDALMLGKQVYVPVAEFAKAMGLTSRWDSKTGALTLSGPRQKTIALTAGSTAAKVGGTAAAALSVPVLKQAGQPVMTLDDLLTLTGGRITGRSGNVVQVKA